MTESTLERIATLVSSMTLEEKVTLLTGADFWTTTPVERIGLRRMVLSDGPSGVRGEVWDERSPSLNLPSATALSSAWDREIARLYGVVSGQEARRKGVDVVLGPTINLHRSPLGGRHFEAFSEDPTLTGELAAAYVEGVQSNGVGATPKHYVANDSETDRFTVNVAVDDRTLREVYLLAFEKPVTEAGAWAVMSAYNSINGATASENDLLETPLNSEWGFDGVVISDWTAVRSIESARHSQDLAMPGPFGPWGAALIAAVESGDIPEAAIDRKVLRLLTLAQRVGALHGFDGAPITAEQVDGVAFARAAASAGSVLLRNEGELPWSASAIGSIAVIGHNARFARTQGGGSATVLPEKVVSPLDGVREAVPGAEVSWTIGAVVQEGVAEFPLASMTNPATGEPGLIARFLDADDHELFREHRRSSALVWFGGAAPITESSMVELSTTYLPHETGQLLVGFASVGRGRIYADDVLVLDETVEAVGTDLGAALLAPPSTSAPVSVVAGTPVSLRLEFDLPTGQNAIPALGLSFGLEPDNSRPAELIAEAVEAARAADVAVVVVGTNSRVESEGFDRGSLSLPGRQDELVRAVAAVNPRTIVVVNAGSPVLLPWRNEVPAVLVGYFGGQEFGHAIADMIFGDVEPGGRLPTTWPAAEADVPVLNVTPVDGVLRYDEGIHIGYRAWLRSGTAPAYPFGHGLGYTTWALADLEAPAAVAAGDGLVASVTVTNTGNRAGKQVMQVFAERAETAIDRPVRWLVGFASVTLDAGASATVEVAVPGRAFAHWSDGWAWEPGLFELRVGTSVDSLPLSRQVLVAS
ncbi:glycoside hydrolase family 3 protein [Lacisediminihabitans sp.]|uniref:glycoside hydrolase family 3 protein n=1 Tax=Lacisediminihabitans sp. TaxID=2787631 RepID=UPI00374D70B2